MQETRVQSLAQEDPLEQEIANHSSIPGWLRGEESACNAGDAGDLGSIPGLERSLEKGKSSHSSILAWRISWTV